MKTYAPFSTAALAVAFGIFAAPVAEMEALTAARNFVGSDPVGSVVFRGKTVSGVRNADGLWIASLAPAGHIVFSGSDLVEPVVCFSPTDYVEPNPESPACIVLGEARAASGDAETAGSGTRNAKWAKLLAERPRALLLATDPVEPAAGAIVVPPFMSSRYDQCQPYNDYCPVYDPDAETDVYRGRVPCGCVATAAAQTFRHFKWPALIGEKIQYDHVFTGSTGSESTFPIRFDGHLPIDWNALDDGYYAYDYVTNFYDGGGYSWEPRYDLRCSVAESARYSISRLVLWTDVMAQMAFSHWGSGATYDSVASGAFDWYTRGTWVNVQDGVEQLKSDILAGIPCQIELEEYDESGMYIGGHLVVANGWAEDASSQYAYISFGWGGYGDGYYNIAGSFQEYQEKSAYVGHYPRAKPQLEPLPRVCGQDVTLNWHFPDFHTNNLQGFTVSVSKTATIITTLLDDFSAPKGVSNAEAGSINNGNRDRLYVGTDTQYGSGRGKLLCAEPLAEGTYTFTNEYVVTSASVLSFRLRSVYACCYDKYEIQARFDDGEWETILAPALTTGGDSGWQVNSAYIGGHDGQKARFRLKVSYLRWEGYYGNTRVLLDDFQVTDVLGQEAPTTRRVAATARSLALQGLDSGASYSFAVTPEIYGALVEGEKSDPVSTAIAGNRTPACSQETITFSSTNSSIWAYSYGGSSTYGSINSYTTLRARSDGYIMATLPGTLTASSLLKFQWSSSNTYNASSKDILSAVFIDAQGNETTLWCVTNTANKTSKQSVSLSLSGFAGQSGSIKVRYYHSGTAATGSTKGGFIYSPSITDVLTPVASSVASQTETMVDLGTPAILSVSNVVNGMAAYPVREGLYRECIYGVTSEFDVECSEHVTNLVAHSSHLALVGEQQVTTRRLGPHTFRVSVDASGIGVEQSRSRMILTLEATDANGTKAYKDLSLRFSDEGETQPLEITTSVLPPGTNGVPYYAALEAVGGVLPYAWSTETSGYEWFVSGSSSFSGAVGTQTGWHGDDSSWKLELPFLFPFCGSICSNVWVGSNGTLTFDGAFTDYSPSREDLQQHPMVAVLWRDLNISSGTGDIYVESSAEAVTIRWSGIYYGATAVSFSATLHADGTIRLSYGAGNASGGMVGIGYGSGAGCCLVRSHSDSTSMDNANDIVFVPQTALPAGLSLSAAGVIAGTPTAPCVTSVVVFVTDSAGTQVGRTFGITVKQPLTIVTSEVPAATSGVPYSVTLEAVGGVGTYTWIGGDSYGYDSRSQPERTFDGTVGTATGWKADDGCWPLALPFDFPFYGLTYSNVWVSSNGILTFGESYANSWYPSDGNLIARKMIAALWKDIDTSAGDIYVESSSADAVTIRWSGAYRNDPSAQVSFSATLYPDGVVRLSYGAGNAGGGWIGISSGNEPFYTLAAECSSESTSRSMDNANDIVFTPWAPLPEWLSLSYGGELSGTPTASGTIALHAYVMDQGVTEVGKTLTLAIEAPPATETSTTPAPVPYSWLDGYAPYFASPAAGTVQNYEELAMQPTGKRNRDGSPTRLWQEYVAGTNPTNENDVFTAFIEMVNSRPVVRWEPDLNSNGLCNVRSYTVLGKTNLADAVEWAPTNSGHRFFKVTVDLIKKGE